LTDLTQRSANALRFGLLGGKAKAFTFSALIDHMAEGCAVLAVSVMEQISTIGQKPSAFHRDIARHLLQPVWFVKLGIVRPSWDLKRRTGK